MLFDSIIKTRRPKRFQYEPRYHNPRQEALDDLVEKAKADRKRGLPSRHALKFERKYAVHDINRGSNRRLFLLIALLAALAWFAIR